MFNKTFFKYAVDRSGHTMVEVANKLSINPATLYRKMNGDSDFTRLEIQGIKDFLGLTIKECDKIFFT